MKTHRKEQAWAQRELMNHTIEASTLTQIAIRRDLWLKLIAHYCGDIDKATASIENGISQRCRFLSVEQLEDL